VQVEVDLPNRPVRPRRVHVAHRHASPIPNADVSEPKPRASRIRKPDWTSTSTPRSASTPRRRRLSSSSRWLLMSAIAGVQVRGDRDPLGHEGAADRHARVEPERRAVPDRGLRTPRREDRHRFGAQHQRTPVIAAHEEIRLARALTHAAAVPARSLRTVTTSSMTCRKPPATWKCSVSLPCRTRRSPSPRSAISGAWPRRIPSSPSQAGAITESASPSKTVRSGEMTTTRSGRDPDDDRRGRHQPPCSSLRAFSIASSMPPTM
jgi:hypothetical protein